jgi:hypothetical protein
LRERWAWKHREKKIWQYREAGEKKIWTQAPNRGVFFVVGVSEGVVKE